MKRTTALVIAGAFLATTALAATCSSTSSCPSSSPCCSEYGECGTGTNCLGGCQPSWSFSPQSCIAQPVCQTANYTFEDQSRMVAYSEYNNDATAVDFTLDNDEVAVVDGNLELRLTQKNGGPRISTTRPVHYGRITARMKTSKWQGVVTAFITMSGMKDEIDWEFVGADADTLGQPNYYKFGYIEDPGHESNATFSPEGYDNFHDFTIDWQQDSLSWLIDGNVVRTTYKNETINGTDYPTTPSRVQFGLWSAGSKGVAKSTQQWAGGATDWGNSDYKANGGYYNTTIAWVNIECADSNQTNAFTAYTYGANVSTDLGPAVNYFNNSTKIYSLDATGTNMYTGESPSTNTTNGTIPGASSDTSSGAMRLGAGAWGAVAFAVALGALGAGALW